MNGRKAKARVRPEFRRQRPPGAAAQGSQCLIRPRGFDLEPVQEAETELARAFKIAGLLAAIDAADRPDSVVVLRPVNQSYVARCKAILKVTSIQNSSKTPPRIAIGWLKKRALQGLESGRFYHSPAKQATWPVRRSVVAPELVFTWLFNDVVFTGQILHGKTERDCLLVQGIRVIRRMRFISIPLRFSANPILRS